VKTTIPIRSSLSNQGKGRLKTLQIIFMRSNLKEMTCTFKIMKSQKSVRKQNPSLKVQ